MPSHHRPARALTTMTTALCAALAVVLLWPSAGTGAGVVTSPGTFKGLGFDACAAPSSRTMDTWMKAKANPYRAVGVYISGGMRACRQSNLTSTWVSHVQSTGWHVLPITVGPQASCSGFSSRVSSNSANVYSAARAQARSEADNAVAAATALGIAPGSTLFYDMENWHTGYNNCDASTLWFLSAWSNQLHFRGYASGVYSSASSGIRLLDKMATATPAGFVLPDHLWYAEWNNRATTSTSYVSSTHWSNHQRVHQFYGGHNATNGGVTINIDSNYLDVAPLPVPRQISGPTGSGSTPNPVPTPTPTASPSTVPSASPSPTVTPTPTTAPSPQPRIYQCTRSVVTRTDYPWTGPGSSAKMIAPLQCMLQQRALYRGAISGTWNSATTTALHRFQSQSHLARTSGANRRTWTALAIASYDKPILRVGSTGPAVIALARALNAAVGAGLTGTGYYGPITRAAVTKYQKKVLGHSTGTVYSPTWAALHAGRIAPSTSTSTSTSRVASARVIASSRPSGTPTSSSSAAASASPSASPSARPTATRPSSSATTSPSAKPTRTSPSAAASTAVPKDVSEAERAHGRTSGSTAALGIKKPTRPAKPALPAHQRDRAPAMDSPVVSAAAPAAPRQLTLGGQVRTMTALSEAFGIDVRSMVTGLLQVLSPVSGWLFAWLAGSSD